jgi:hypothetical protein
MLFNLVSGIGRFDGFVAAAVLAAMGTSVAAAVADDDEVLLELLEHAATIAAVAITTLNTARTRFTPDSSPLATS